MGLIFDIKEFALNDGSGIRTTVFFKGCPLRCIWCHNPEGPPHPIPRPQRQPDFSGRYAGTAQAPGSPGACRDADKARNAGSPSASDRAHAAARALSERLLRQAGIYRETGGGVTLSGGEPLLQWEFACELLELLHGKAHAALETSGYADAEVFRAVAGRCDFVYMDLKLMDNEAHRAYTGVSNDRILRNAAFLKSSGKPHAFRTPLIPGITDTAENLAAIRAFVGTDAWECLPYNTLAPAKYASVGRKFGLPDRKGDATC